MLAGLSSLGAPMAQDRQFSSPCDDYAFQPVFFFAPNALSRQHKGAFPTAKAPFCIREGALFVNDGVILSRYGTPPASRGAILARIGAFLPVTAPS